MIEAGIMFVCLIHCPDVCLEQEKTEGNVGRSEYMIGIQ